MGILLAVTQILDEYHTSSRLQGRLKGRPI